MSNILLPTGIIGASGFDPDAINFLNVAGITDTTQRYALNTAVRDLKNAGLWTKIDAAYPIIGSTATTQKYNLKDPRDQDAAYRLEFYGGIAHGANGFSGNATNAYADTNFDVSLLASGDAHIGFYQRFNWVPAGVEVDMGAYKESAPASGALLASEIVTGTTRGRLFANAADYANSDQRGFFMITTTSDTRLFTNGVKRTTIANSGTITQSGSIYISALNATQIPGPLYYTQGGYAWATIGKGLSDSEATAYYNIVQAYQTTLGRQV